MITIMKLHYIFGSEYNQGELFHALNIISKRKKGDYMILRNDANEEIPIAMTQFEDYFTLPADKGEAKKEAERLRLAHEALQEINSLSHKKREKAYALWSESEKAYFQIFVSEIGVRLYNLTSFNLTRYSN